MNSVHAHADCINSRQRNFNVKQLSSLQTLQLLEGILTCLMHTKLNSFPLFIYKTCQFASNLVLITMGLFLKVPCLILMTKSSQKGSLSFSLSAIQESNNFAKNIDWWCFLHGTLLKPTAGVHQLASSQVHSQLVTNFSNVTLQQSNCFLRDAVLVS